MLVRLNIAWPCAIQYLLPLSTVARWVSVLLTRLPQIPCALIRRPRPGVNHLPIATATPGLERKSLNGLTFKSSPCSWPEYHAFQSAPTWRNQLLQKEFVATLYFFVGTSSCAKPAIEKPANANTIKIFFIIFILLFKQSIQCLFFVISKLYISNQVQN